MWASGGLLALTCFAIIPGMEWNRLNKVLLGLAGVLFAAGLVGVFYYVYNDVFFFQHEYQELTRGQASEFNAKFQSLRESQRTAKHQILDPSVSVVLIGLLLAALSRVGVENVRAPKAKWTVAALGMLAVILTATASIADFVLSRHRGEIAHCADSMEFPCTGDSMLFYALLLWACAHLWFLRGRFSPGEKIFRSETLKQNFWLTLNASFALIILLEETYFGRFMMIIPASVWIYFYLSLAAGRTKTADSV